jgi:hypothetical protein
MLLATSEREKLQWANWLLSHTLSRDDRVRYALYAAKSVLHVFESKCPNDKRPRKAIIAAKNHLKHKDAKSAYAAAYAAYAAYAAAYAAADAADAAADAAYAAAYAAARAAADTADADAAYAADADADADAAYAADAAAERTRQLTDVRREIVRAQ